MRHSDANERDERILILAPTGRDSAMSSRFFAASNLPTRACASIESICAELHDGCGLMLLTGEAVTQQALRCLAEALTSQPHWSDIPLIVLTSGGGATPSNAAALASLGEVGNVTLVERPVRGETLLSAVKSALRARRRQYEVRDHLAAEVLANEALRASEERLRIALDAAQLGAWQLDLSNQHFECTPVCKAHYGRGPADPFDGEDLFASIHSKDRDAVREEFQRALRDHDIFHKEFRTIWPDLSLHWVLAAGRATFDAAGNPLAMTGVTLDITERMTAEQQREQLLARTQAARAEAEAASHLKDDFLATVSHELRTPLMAIMGWSSLMRTGQVDGDMLPVALETIERNARSQSQLINDLLDVSRIISGKLRLETEPMEFRPVVDAAVAAMRPTADEKDIQLHVNLAAEPGTVLGDSERLQQIVWNLLSNAIKFTPDGGDVYIDMHQTATEVELTVRDTGRGISAEFLDHVFDRFRQADQTSKRNHGGLGLGLSIVRQLVDLHTGTISAASDGEGTGATFMVRIPLLHTAPVNHHKNGHADRDTVARTVKNHRTLDNVRVLVVDDEPDTRLVLQSALESHGSVVVTASNVAEAFELFTTWQPHVLVSDIGLPGEDGYALIRRIRDHEASTGGSIPAMALTAYVREEDRFLALEAGFQTHVAKPLEPNEFIAAVADLARPKFSPPRM